MAGLPGAPIGNQNAARGRIWRDAIERALAKKSKAEGIEAIDALAEQLINLAFASDLSALKEVGDRLEGKCVQDLKMMGPNGGPVEVSDVTDQEVARRYAFMLAKVAIDKAFSSSREVA